MRNITIFSPFSKNENDISNYCAAMMKLIYQDSPMQFNRLMEMLFIDYGDVPFFGPEFSQQSIVQSTNPSKKKSISDISITQSCINVVFETKKSWYGFSTKQINRYITKLSSDECCCQKYLVLLSNFDGKDWNSIPAIANAIKAPDVTLVPVDFEQLIDAMMEVSNNEFILQLLEELYLYLDDLGVLPSWKYRMEIINCRQSMGDVEKYNVYWCPDSYPHKRAMFFATYADKTINHIYRIRSIVKLSYNASKGDTEAEIIHNNVSKNNVPAMLAEAKNIIDTYRPTEVRHHDMKVFLLDERKDIIFTKTSRGGMMASKMYVEQINKNYKSSDIASKLNNDTWIDKSTIQNLLTK